jgi:hypothetical protein
MRGLCAVVLLAVSTSAWFADPDALDVRVEQLCGENDPPSPPRP